MLERGESIPSCSCHILTGLILQVKAAILSFLFFFLFISICKSETVPGRKHDKNLERFTADGTVCNREKFETNKALICPVWIIVRFILLPVYRFLYFLHRISRGMPPESFLPALCAQKVLLVFHLQMFIVY